MTSEYRPASIPVTVIGGYLGAGKTTLVNALLRDSRGERLAVIVNDFGALAIDADLIASHDGETVQLTNGCICCSLARGLADAMFSLRDSGRVDRVVIEASGVADPVATAQYAHLPGFHLDAVVVLAAADSIRRLSRDRYVARQIDSQLRGADVIVLTKGDLVGADRIHDVRSWLADVAPGVPVVRGDHGEVPRAVLFDVATDDRRPAADCIIRDEFPVEHESWAFQAAGPVDLTALAELVASLPDAVVRVKGIVTSLDDPTTRRVVHRVGRRVTWSDVPGSTHADSRLVLIGLPGSANEPTLTSALDRLTSLFLSSDAEVLT